MTFRRLGEIIGQSASTTHYWFEVFQHPQIVALLTLFERLPSTQRNALLDRYCRPLPCLEHPRIAHSPTQVEGLKRVLAKPNGFTLLTGGTDEERDFVFTALGHSLSKASLHRTGPVGIDIHRPTDLVPVSTLKYIDPNLTLNRTRELVSAVLPQVLTSDSGLLLFNRVWSVVPAVRTSIIQQAVHRHVILSERTMVKANHVPPALRATTHVVQFSGATESKIHIQLGDLLI